ncbi:MAG: hypothetical protein HUJ74_00220 [Lachnospiraceae bacterium]|nr:hypothetical protein [Lachnospiraceae bacterium]
MQEEGLIAFITNSAVLSRLSGVSEQSMNP